MNLKDKRILVVGASSDIAVALNDVLHRSEAILGFHYNANKIALSKYAEGCKVKKFQKNLNSSKACYDLIDSFVRWTGGIDYLIQLSGDIRRPVHWEKSTEEDWHYDLSINLIAPFFLAQRAALYMKKNGGRIILMSTASVSHGGGPTSVAYGAAKAGIEFIVKRLAKDCAEHNILCNAVAPGFFITKFHTKKMKKQKAQLRQRIKMIPLGRAGTVEEFAGLVTFLLSEPASYITGQVIALSGGDWL